MSEISDYSEFSDYSDYSDYSDFFCIYTLFIETIYLKLHFFVAQINILQHNKLRVIAHAKAC